MKKLTLLSVFLLYVTLFANGQWIYNDLPEPRHSLSSASLGNKVYFAGGDNGSSSVYRVEVYDIIMEDWDTVIELSVGRAYPVCATTGTKVFFAGGLDWYSSAFFSEVDIWDAVSKTWTYEQLSIPRFSLCAAAKGNKALFAGGANLALGETYSVVDIYDISTGTWSVSSLSIPRNAMGSAVLGDMAFFAGGHNAVTNEVYDRVDIYHFSTGTWTTDALSVARTFLTARAVGSKVLFAGGNLADDQSTNIVDIYDTITGTWEIGYLSVPRSFVNDYSATVSGKAYFVGGGEFNFGGYWETCSDVIDIYNPEVDEWTTDIVTHQLVNHTVAGNNGHLLVAGGQCGPPYSTVEIFLDISGVPSSKEKDPFFRIYPNPTNGKAHLELLLNGRQGPAEATVYNLQGQLVHQQTLSSGNQEINLQVPNGVYVLKVQYGETMQQELITIQK
jgi:hypothetical protein